MTPNPQDSAVALEVERAAFEAWAKPLGDSTWREKNDRMLAWDAWQARASQSDGTSGVPEGWKLVPVEPTEAMHAAAVRTIVRCIGNDDFPPRVYRAMLAAAPNQSQGENHVG